MINSIEKLIDQLVPVREKLLAHEVYAAVNDLDQLREFAKYHVFAVWDFMSLLKGLQQQLTCVTVPWVPVGSGNVRYLINEIVTGEESDEALSLDNQPTRRVSHFELYREAMQQMGADTALIDQLLRHIRDGKPVNAALENVELPEGVRDFVRFTFDTIQTGKAHLMAAVFTFGREDLIPEMFLEIVRQLDESHQEKLTLFRYYLERHIELDGDHHSQLAMQMVEELCGNDPDKWEEARQWTIWALQKRIALWDAVLQEVSVREQV